MKKGTLVFEDTRTYSTNDRRGILAGDLIQISSLGGGGPTIECNVVRGWPLVIRPLYLGDMQFLLGFGRGTVRFDKLANRSAFYH